MKLDGSLASIEQDGQRLLCGGGARLPQAAAFAARAGLSGLEFGVNIPGTVGGAVKMNANAYGGDLARVLEWVEVTTPDGTERRAPDELGFRYRRSNLGASEIVARASFALSPAEPDSVKATLADMRASRKAAQPSGIKTFGSTFKNPDDPRAEGRSAGVLLDEAGCRGLTVGGARFSEKHANFVENMGEATTADVIALMAEGRRRVRERFGVELEPEVQFLGEVDTSPLWGAPRTSLSSGQAVAGRRPGAERARAEGRGSARRSARTGTLRAFAVSVLTLRLLPPRMRRRVLMVLAVCLVLAAGFQFWLRDSPLVAVEDVKVTGLTTKDAPRVRAALASAAHNMTTLHVDHAELERAIAAYPVVRALEVNADFPHRLEIRVLEHRPAALVGGLPVAGDGTILRGLPVEGSLPKIDARREARRRPPVGSGGPARRARGRRGAGAAARPPGADRRARRGGHRRRAPRRPRAVLRRRHATSAPSGSRPSASSPTPRRPARATSTCACPAVPRREGCPPRPSRPWRRPAAPSSRAPTDAAPAEPGVDPATEELAPPAPATAAHAAGLGGHRRAAAASRPHPPIPPGLEGSRRLPDNPQPVVELQGNPRPSVESGPA